MTHSRPTTFVGRTLLVATVMVIGLLLAALPATARPAENQGLAAQPPAAARPASIFARLPVTYYQWLPLTIFEPTPTPLPGFFDHFNGSMPTWQIVESTGYDGPPGTSWYNVWNADGYMHLWVNDRWEHVIASPVVESIEPPFEIRTRVYFAQRSWSSGYAIVFGSPDPNFSTIYYRINVVYVSGGGMKYQVKVCLANHCGTGLVLSAGSNVEDGYRAVPLEFLDGQAWNTWSVIRDGDNIIVAVNDHTLGVYQYHSDSAPGQGYFGVMASTWEFRPIEVWVDYYSLQPR